MPGLLFESLENRVMLGYDPGTYPLLADLVSQDNTVVRFNTTLGFVDIELFDQAGPNGATGTAAPNTAANFLNYVMSGRYDETIYHRMVTFGDEGDPNDILQGGGFSFTNPSGVGQVEQDDPIANEFANSRLNLERTIAMAKLSLPDTATSQWFFNLTDNPELDNPNNAGGFTVFGRVADDASWNVIMAISALETFCFADVQVDGNGDAIRDIFGQIQPLPGGDPLIDTSMAV
jgi:cyclophilin family peptidyl-prolyl cis-trans isomerase